MANNCWGQMLSLDLKDCDLALISDGEYIKKYLVEVVKVLKMKMFGEPQAIRFALHDPKVAGYSAMCWLETSSITAHFSEMYRGCYIDIFSCSEINIPETIKFTKNWFKAKDCTYNFLIRNI